MYELARRGVGPTVTGGGDAVHKMLREFKAIAMQGNMLDLAVGIVLGIAFKAVIDALSTNVIGGFLGAIFGKPNFDALSWKVGKGEVGYGALLRAREGTIRALMVGAG